MQFILPTIRRARGAASNPPNRFVPIDFQVDGDFLDDEEQPAPRTVYLKNTARSILARNDSPDVGFTWSLNAYRGCSHGWMYSSIIPRLKFGSAEDENGIY